jgi:hypothetical protein
VGGVRPVRVCVCVCLCVYARGWLRGSELGVGGVKRVCVCVCV